MRLALKTQSQCRATLETLAEIKNPRSVAFVAQANIANVPQQINNHMSGRSEPLARAHARDPVRPTNELLGACDGERLDTGAAAAAIGTDPHLEAVGAINRPEDCAREGG
jgi:hypothetical protein